MQQKTTATIFRGKGEKVGQEPTGVVVTQQPCNSWAARPCKPAL